MAEEERISVLSEKDGTDTSQSKDTYVPEEPTPDISISLLDIQMPETPDSTKGQISDGDTSRLESPKTVKPVLGKVQAKKRLMAFANQFKALSKSSVKPNLSQHSSGTLKTKDKTIQDDMNINKSRKKTEEKILAIEEIRREESKSKMLLAEAMAAASMEDEHHISKSASGSFEKYKKKEKIKYQGRNDDRKYKSMDRKYLERHRHRDKFNKNSSSQDVKDRNGSIERFTQKSSQNKEKHKKEKKKKDDKSKRDNSKTDVNRDKKEEGKDKKENEKEKQEETKDRIETKNKKENLKERRNDMLEIEIESKKKEIDKDKWKEKVLKSNSWAEVRKSGLTLDDIIYLKRRDNSERSNIKLRATQDYTRYLEQMLMLNNHRLKRQALIAEGLNGPKKYPPESIKLTKRSKGLQLSYCENPRISLLLNISQLLQIVSPERREKIRNICEAALPRIETEDTVHQERNWYQQINTTKYHKDTKWQMTVQLPKSKWDSEEEEISSINVTKEEVEEPVNKLHVSMNQQERCSTTSSVTEEDKIDNNAESIKKDNKSSEKTEIENIITSETSTSLLQTAGNEKLASEYEQFMKMVCTATDETKEYSPKKNPIKSTSPHSSYHEFDIESNLAEDNINVEIPLKEKFERRNNQTLEESIKRIEGEESTLSTECQIQVNENDIQIEHINENDDSEDSKSIPSDWENVRIKVERLSDENTESRKMKKKKQKKITSSSDSSSSTTESSDTEKEKKKRKRKRKELSNSSSSDSDSTDSSSSSSDSSSSEERKKRKRKKKKIEKKRKKAKRTARIKKKRRRKISTDSNSSDDSDKQTKKRKKAKKKALETKSINNGDISKIIPKSPVIASSSDGTTILQSVTPAKKIKEEAAGEDRKRSNQVTSTKKSIADISEHDNECLKQKREGKEIKSDENFMEQWEMDSMMQQNDGDASSQDCIEELEKMDSLEKDKYRKKRKHSRDNIEYDKDKSSKVSEEKTSSDEEVEMKRKKRRERDKSSAEFLANWEREGERITQQIQNEVKYLKKLGKQKKEKWGETDFDTLNVPSLTQLEKEVCQKQLLADEWEVDSLEAISDPILNKRKTSQGSSKKIEKEVKYDKKTDTYIAIEKERVREMKKRQERLCAVRIWEEEQEEGEKEEMMLLEQKSKQHKTDDWDIEEESLFHKDTEEMEVCKVNDIVVIEKEWTKTDEEKNIKEDANKLIMKPSKRVKKSRWDMGSQSKEKLEAKDIWEEEYAEWKINKCEQEFEKTKKDRTNYSEDSSKSDLIDFYHRKPQSRESLERSWTSEEVAFRPVQAKIDPSVKHFSVKTNEEQLTSIKEHQTRDQFKEILESSIKFKEKTLELYSPSSPALSQKSQDVEASNESSSCNSLLREKRKKEMLITADELSMSGIPLQLTKLRDTKHTSNEKIDNFLNKVQLEDKDPTRNFDIKITDNLFDDISMNESCPKINTSERMDIFAEYGSEKPCGKQYAVSSTVSSITHTKDDEANEGKNALKLIPNQLLIRRTNEQIKPKRILETPLQDPAQHAAALLTIQKKLLESHVLKNDIKEYPIEEQMDHFEQKYNITSNSRTDNMLLDTTEFSVVSKSSVTAIRQSRSPVSEKAVSIRSEQSENYDRESKNDIKRYKSNRNLSDTNVPSSARSPVREYRRRSPSKKKSEKRYLHDKERKEKKSDDAEKSDRRDTRNSKADFADRKRSSPSRRGRRRSGSPYLSWERQGSGSGSPGHSWSRSRSKSPKKKDEATTSTRDKKRERYDDERSGRSRTDERKERYTRSSPRSNYNEDNFKKHGSSKNNRDDWSRRRYDNMDRDHEKDTRLYDPMEILRERTVESEKYRDRYHTGESDHTFWQYENSDVLRDGNDGNSMDSYTVGQDLPLEYDDRSYYREGSLERDMIQSSPQSQSKYRKSKSNARRERQWEKDKDSSDLDRHLGHKLRNRTPPRSRYSPMRQAPERFRRKSRSRSRSWSSLRSRSRSRSDSRSRSTSRSRPRIRSQSRSRSRSPFDVRLRGKSTSMSRLRSPEHAFRMSELRSSRSPSLGRDRLNEIERERRDDDENKKFTNVEGERGRRIETIVQTGIIPGTSILDSEININSSMDTTVSNFQYSSELEGGNEYYYTENNLTYPPCIDESSTSSPKRLSLDDRLELELGIKKQHNKDSIITSSEYSNFNSNVIAYPSPPPQQQQQMMYRQQPTVVQVGNVLQVVPADFNGVQSVRREVPAAAATPPVRSGSSQVVRVGNVLQVVPTSLDWSSSNNGGQSSSTTDQSSGVLYSSAVPAVSPSTSSVSMSVPVPVPVPLPVPPALPAATNTLAPVATMSSTAPLPLSLPVPVPVPVPIPPATPTAFPRNEPQKIVQPVYNYEAILETRRKEREERKRLRELRRKEKERRRIERVNRRALRLLEKSNTSRQASGALDHRKGAIVDASVLKALKEGEEQAESSLANPIKEEEEVTTSIKEEDEDVIADEEEDDDEDEAEVEDDEEEEEEAEDEDEEEEDDDDKPLQMINQRIEVDEATASADANKDQTEIETKNEWPELLPPPLKGILVVPGFRRDAIPNGNLNDSSDADDSIKDESDKDEEIDKNNECDKNAGSDAKSKSNLGKVKKTKRNKKSVQFADGIKPGEGTSPSGGEGDMPSPPPPKGIDFRDGLGDLRRDKIYRKSRKQEKRARPPKAKKKVKVKIIKLKKPRITPLTAMMMDDSDEMDDRSPPPPPPGSPPPPHLWPSYLSIYNTTIRTIEQSQTTTTTLTPVQAPPPPTPLPLLIPPPPLTYTIQPCSKS